jgi:iron complex transport system substrate-binding protein
VNPWGDDACKSRPLTDDEVREAAPDAVVISWCGVPERRYRRDVVTRRAAWSGVPALTHGQVWPISEAYLGRPGPRLVDGLRLLAEVVDAVAATPR